ncbi:MAG: hypothetical protein QM726_01030 [Chitinophagaceae bacterium]
MSKPKKTSIAGSVEVYLYYLLKRMIEFEVKETLSVEPLRDEVINYIRNCSQFSENERSTVAEFVRYNLWKPKPEKIGLRELNWMVRIITKLGHFSSWKDFESHFSNEFHPDKNTKLTDNHSEEDIRTRTQAILTILYYRSWQKGKLKFSQKQHILFSQMEYHDVTLIPMVHRLKLDDVYTVCGFYNEISSAYHREYATLIEWYEKNPFIFFATMDSGNGVTSILTILPLKEDFINDVKKGNRSKSDIESTDIYSIEDRIATRHVFIEALMSYQISAIREYRVLFNRIVELVADIGRADLVICAIACSVQAQTLLETYGFTMTADITRIDDGPERYPFYEISWSRLDQRLAIFNSAILTTSS